MIRFSPLFSPFFFFFFFFFLKKNLEQSIVGSGNAVRQSALRSEAKERQEETLSDGAGGSNSSASDRERHDGVLGRVRVARSVGINLELLEADLQIRLNHTQHDVGVSNVGAGRARPERRGHRAVAEHGALRAAELDSVRVEQREIHTLSRDERQTSSSRSAASVDSHGVDQIQQRARGAIAVNCARRRENGALLQHNIVRVAKHRVATARRGVRRSLLVGRSSTAVAASLSGNRTELSASGSAQRRGEQSSSVGVAETSTSRGDGGRVEQIQAEHGREGLKRASLARAHVAERASGAIVVHTNPVAQRRQGASRAESNHVVLNVSDPVNRAEAKSVVDRVGSDRAGQQLGGCLARDAAQVKLQDGQEIAHAAVVLRVAKRLSALGQAVLGGRSPSGRQVSVGSFANRQRGVRRQDAVAASSSSLVLQRAVRDAVRGLQLNRNAGGGQKEELKHGQDASKAAAKGERVRSSGAASLSVGVADVCAARRLQVPSDASVGEGVLSAGARRARRLLALLQRVERSIVGDKAGGIENVSRTSASTADSVLQTGLGLSTAGQSVGSRAIQTRVRGRARSALNHFHNQVGEGRNGLASQNSGRSSSCLSFSFV
jgi:hypothetical protein